jgi:hypothetical protein
MRDGSITAHRFGPRVTRYDIAELDAVLSGMPAVHDDGLTARPPG